MNTGRCPRCGKAKEEVLLNYCRACFVALRKSIKPKMWVKKGTFKSQQMQLF